MLHRSQPGVFPFELKVHSRTMREKKSKSHTHHSHCVCYVLRGHGVRSQPDRRPPLGAADALACAAAPRVARHEEKLPHERVARPLGEHRRRRGAVSCARCFAPATSWPTSRQSSQCGTAAAAREARCDAACTRCGCRHRRAASARTSADSMSPDGILTAGYKDRRCSSTSPR